MVRLTSGVPLRVRWASLRFAAQRSDYYEYIASCLASGARHRSLLDLFEADASRHGVCASRAILTRWWASRYLLSGGSLQETFEGTLPDDDIACLAMTQSAGQGALVEMLFTMSHRARLLHDCRRAFLQTTLVGLIALTTALLTFTWLPVHTLEHLMRTFSMVSSEFHGPCTKALQTWVEIVRRGAWVMCAGSLLIACLLRWALHNWVGSGRDRLDSVGMWRFVRDRQAIHFMSLTASLVKTLGSRGVSLRAIVERQVTLACPWLRSHLLRMLVSMDLGAQPLDAMNTGLVDQEIWSRLQDVVSGYGLTQGFSQASDRVMDLLLRRMRRQALITRWLLLLASVASVLAMGYWHVRVLEEFRQAMLLGLAGL